MSEQSAAAPLTLKVVMSSESSLHALFTIVMGETDAVLIDAPFTKADAHRLVAEIIEAGKNLKAIYITHDHPDHFFSIDVLAQAFPNAEIVSASYVVSDIWASIPFKVKRWSPMLGANGPAHPFAPTALEADHIELEGHRLEIVGPLQGDHHHCTAVYIPSLRALIAGDLAFNKIHLWLGEATAEMRAAWLVAIDKLIALKPSIVVPGHKLPGLPDDISSLNFTRDYLVKFEEGVHKSRTSDELMQWIHDVFPDTEDVLGGFILPNSAKVAMGEDPPWKE